MDPLAADHDLPGAGDSTRSRIQNTHIAKERRQPGRIHGALLTGAHATLSDDRRVCDMIDHLGLQVADVETSLSFYLDAFAPIGIREMMRFPVDESFVVGLGAGDFAPDFWLSPAQRPDDSELHVAFIAPDRAAVDAVHEAALRLGAEVLHAPREWPEYHRGYYGVFLRDPDGHNVEAVHHGG
jgi:catechol 2,3-dioxygenase-like lactoylglutathione lyase family enzyme